MLQRDIARDLLLLLNESYLYYDNLLNLASSAILSTRKLVSTYGGNCIRLRRSTDNAESDFGFVGNALDTAGIAAWLGAGTGFLKTWYDQSGNGYNAGQSTAANQPQYTAPAGTDPPIFVFGSNDFLTISIDLGGLNKATAFCAARVSSFAANQLLFEYSASLLANPGVFMVFETAGKLQVATKATLLSYWTSTAVAADGSKKVLTAIYNMALATTEAVGYINGVSAGTDTSSDNAGNWTTQTMYIGMRGGASIPYLGELSEWIFTPELVSAVNRGIIETDMQQWFNSGF